MDNNFHGFFILVSPSIVSFSLSLWNTHFSSLKLFYLLLVLDVCVAANADLLSVTTFKWHAELISFLFGFLLRNMWHYDRLSSSIDRYQTSGEQLKWQIKCNAQFIHHIFYFCLDEDFSISLGAVMNYAINWYFLFLKLIPVLFPFWFFNWKQKGHEKSQNGQMKSDMFAYSCHNSTST